MNKLKPCPFCGGELEKQEYVPLRFRYIHPKNDCILSIRICIYTTSEIEAWNRRVENESK